MQKLSGQDAAPASGRRAPTDAGIVLRAMVRAPSASCLSLYKAKNSGAHGGKAVASY